MPRIKGIRFDSENVIDHARLTDPSQRYLILPKPFPTILGTSFAGIVQEVGEGVISFAPGDRVVARRSGKTSNDARYGPFQRHVLATIGTASKLSPDTPLEPAAASIVNLSTMCSLLSVCLKLDHPSLSRSSAPSPENAKIKVLVYGGSSSCGSLGIRYASDAGYTVVTTSSPQNMAFVAQLGAAHIVDHTQPAEKIVAELKAHGPYDAVVDCISTPETFAIAEKLVPEKSGELYGLLPDMGYKFQLGVAYKFFSYSAMLQEEENVSLGKWLYDEYLPKGLANGRVVPTRHVTRAGGLGAVQGTLDELLDQGISGKKFLVAL